MTIIKVCDLIGPGPGAIVRQLYNDTQCKNGYAGFSSSEVTCPGHLEEGAKGCCHQGNCGISPACRIQANSCGCFC